MYKPKPKELAGELLEAYIMERQLKPGDKLPPERMMCEMWSLNRSTLRRAIAKMERDGLLRSKPGSGTYLSAPKFNRILQDLHSLSWSAAEQRRNLSNRLLNVTRIECDKTLAKQFGQMLGYPLYKIVRLRSIDGQPLMLETAFIPEDRAEGLPDRDLEGNSLFETLEEYGLIPERGDEKIGITYATADEAELMRVPEKSPMFWIVSKTYDQTGSLMEYCRTVARPDLMRLTSVLEQRDPALREEKTADEG
jgi:GntR family transcriptional regulator